MTAFEDNQPSARKRVCTRFESDDLETAVWSWYEKARSLLIPVSGLMHPELSSVLSLQTASEDHIQTGK